MAVTFQPGLNSTDARGVPALHKLMAGVFILFGLFLAVSTTAQQVDALFVAKT